MIQVDRGLLTRATLVWGGCFVAALLVDPHSWVLSTRGLTESILWLLLLWLPAFMGRVSEALGELPRRQRRFLAAVLGAVLFGQLAGWESERTFPLASWRMFSTQRALQDLTFFDYVGDASDGATIPLNPTRLFPSINHSIMMGLAKLAEEAGPQATTDERATAAPRRLTNALRAIGRMHNRLNPEVPVHSVSLVRCTLNAGAPAGQRHVQRQRVWTVSVAEGP